MHQTELNFVPAAELRKDTLRAIASVAHGGGGVRSPRKRGRPRTRPAKIVRANVHNARTIAERLGVTTATPQRYWRDEHAPKPVECFYLWFALRKQKTKKFWASLGRKLKICAECGSEFRPNSHDSKYCNQDCVSKRNARAFTLKRDWEAQAVKLCKSESRGFKSIARILKVSPMAVYSVLKKHGLLNPEKHRAARPIETYKGGIGGRGPNPEIHIRNTYARELSVLKRFDESHHWGNHPERMRQNLNRVAKRQFAKWKHDPQKKLKRAMRSRIWKVLRLQKQNKRGRKTFSLIGCSPLVLSQWLESQWVDGMTWENHGTKWEVDHVKPCALFDLSIQSQAEECFHFQNLAPLWKSDNRKKSSNFNGQFHRHSKLIYVKKAA